MQLDQGEKGFSFSKEGPLDMRMDPTAPLTAKEVVNTWSQQELQKIFFELGEEPRSKRVAEAICLVRKKQPIETTKQLADIVSSAIGFHGKKKLHPATLIFQALRICVNDELGSLQAALQKVIHFLTPGGRVGVLSFHSLEDRIVKNVFKDAARVAPKRERRVEQPVLRLVTKKPLVPTEEEMRANPRSRSAKLRFAEKM